MAQLVVRNLEEVIDGLLAATARVHNLTPATRNVKDGRASVWIS
ncbi:MAG TPA: hypothetical protein VM364_13675 [Vicinamibacterales bacterium]|nr:hypothetical protein [Vicinamibacterales bacterium]